jgi:glycine cleavage system H protein
MDRLPLRPNSARPPPDNALSCVWMTAGLVAYKLCDREYDCENCPLDAALRGPTSNSHGSTSSSNRKDRQYHPSHSWVKEIDETRVRVGLDAFAGRLLDQITSVVLPPISTRILCGRPACWVIDDAELLPVRAAVSGTVLQKNGAVQHNPSLIAQSAYDDGWLLEVQCCGPLSEQPGLVSAHQQQEETTTQLRQLAKFGAQDPTADSRLGPTMANGGEPITSLRRFLGAKRYHRLIQQFLS